MPKYNAELADYAKHKQPYRLPISNYVKDRLAHLIITTIDRAEFLEEVRPALLKVVDFQESDLTRLLEENGCIVTDEDL